MSDNAIAHPTYGYALRVMDEAAASEFVLGKLKDFKANAEFFESMKR